MNDINPLLIDFPDSIRTKRLLLRAPQCGDGRLINEAILESLEALQQWMPWAQVAPTLEQSELFTRQGCIKWLERKQLEFRGFHHETFVLAISLQNIDWHVPKFEIGYWMRTSATGQGLMTEAVVAVTEFAFDTLGARRIEIRCDAKHERSRRVAARAGFKLESTIVNDERSNDGLLRDTCVFVRTAAAKP